MTPPYAGPTSVNTQLYWLITGVSGGIDLNRMSTSDRRDFPQGVSGSHMAADPTTPFKEVRFTKAPAHSYLLAFDANLNVADCRRNTDPTLDEQLYGPTHDLSQQIFVRNTGEFQALGINGIVRWSAPCLAEGIKADVYALLPEARQHLTLRSITPIGPNSPPVRIRLFGEDDYRSTTEFPTAD